MKQICRDFTIVVGVPDDVKPEDCEIVIDKATATFSHRDATTEVADGDIDINAEDPYEHID